MEHGVLTPYFGRICSDLIFQFSKTSSSPCWIIITFLSSTFLSEVGYVYYHRKCSDGLYFFFAPGLIFESRNHHTTYIIANGPHSLRIPYSRHKFNSDISFPRKTALWNRLPRGCFSQDYNFKLFTAKFTPATHKHIHTHTYSPHNS